MSGRIAYIPPQPHDCDHPPDGSHPTWTRWDCDCGERWIVLPGFPGEVAEGQWARWPHDKQQEPVGRHGWPQARRWPWKRSKEAS